MENGEEEIKFIEGSETKVSYKGSINPIVDRFLSGLASGMTYVGAREIKDIVGKVDFILK